MTQAAFRRQSLSRRSVIAGGAGLAGAAALAPGLTRAQQPNANLGTPASVISNPPRQWGRHNPSIYPDPDVIVVDPSFLPLRRTQGAIYRLWTGALWPRGAGLVEPGAIRRLQRRLGQCAIPLHLG